MTLSKSPLDLEEWEVYESTKWKEWSRDPALTVCAISSDADLRLFASTIAPFDGTATRSCEDLTNASGGAVVAVTMRSDCGGASSLSLVEEARRVQECGAVALVVVNDKSEEDEAWWEEGGDMSGISIPVLLVRSRRRASYR